jgi:DNA-binding NarL/FixJ family response regulator
VRVLIADHTSALVAASEAERVADGRSALAMARVRAPAVALVHAGLPDAGGLALVAPLRVLGVPALVAAPEAAPEALAACLRAGARGLVALDAPPADLDRALDAVAAGLLFAGPGGRDALLAAVEGSPRPFAALSRREHDVLARLAYGDGTERIARGLGMAPKTVRNHVATITVKLGVRDRSHAARLARDAGLPVAV